MKTASSAIELVKISGAEVIQIASVNRVEIDEGQLRSIDGSAIKSGDYLIAEVRIVIPVDG